MQVTDNGELSITPRLIVAELKKRGVVFDILSHGKNDAFIRYKDSAGMTRYTWNVIFDKAGALGERVADNKDRTYLVAETLGIAVPQTIVVRGDKEAEAFLAAQGSIVVKPVDAAHGHGVSVGVRNVEALHRAIERARQYSSTVLLQQQITDARDLRLLFIDGEYAAAVMRVPAVVVGDGKHTVRQLIELENASGRRSEGYSEKLCVISLEQAVTYLGEGMEAVPEAGKSVQVTGTANVGSGGLAVEVTDALSPDMIADARKLVHELRMPVCGVDFLGQADGSYYLIEINASPTFGFHHFPHEGEGVDVTARFVDMIMRPE